MFDARHVVCTLAEGRHFLGAAALINSLVRAGFVGDIVIGYRGALPDWLNALDRDRASGIYTVNSNVRLQLVEIERVWHLSNCKPELIQLVFASLFPKAELVYYFDTDIVITQTWDMFAEWANYGVVLTLDSSDSHMSPHHVYRRPWRALAKELGLDCRDITGYFNGGCIGIHRVHSKFADVWASLMYELERSGADMRCMKDPKRNLAFARMDQDVLNAAVMATEVPMAMLGYEAMGMFPWFGEAMPHAMWGSKPWDRNYIADSLRGFPPGRVHNAYWSVKNTPIKAWSDSEYRSKRLQLRIGNWIGLLHMRSFRDL